MMRRVVTVLVLLTGVVAVPAKASGVAAAGLSPAFDQDGRAGARQVGPGPAAGGPVSVAEAERIFDRYMLGQARVVLQLTPDQMVQFAQRFERVQALQRLRQRQRQRRLAELTVMGRSGGAADETAMAGLLQSLDAEMAEADRRVREAREDLDAVLTVRQRVRYRAFEARMEREKLQLINRARAEARGRAGQGGAPD